MDVAAVTRAAFFGFICGGLALIGVLVYCLGFSPDLYRAIPVGDFDATATLTRPNRKLESAVEIRECLRHEKSISQHTYVGKYVLTHKVAQGMEGVVRGEGENESSCYALCFRQRYFALGEAGACMCYDQIDHWIQCRSRPQRYCATFYEINSDDIADYMLRGLSRASQYNSQQCLQARDDAHMREWIDISGGFHGQGVVGGTLLGHHGKVHPCIVKPAPTAFPEGASSNQLFYVTNQKAASTSTTYMMARLMQSKSRASFCFRGVRRKGCKPYQYKLLHNKVTFTMVSDPIQTFASGFVETVCRMPTFIKGLKGRNPGTSITYAMALAKSGWPNLTSGNASKLFNMFINDVEHRRQLGLEAFHAWPQALKINLDLNITFIGDVSTYKKSFLSMLPGMRIPAETLQRRTNSEGMSPEVRVCRAALSPKLEITAEARRRLCRVLFVDYVCFGMELPSECQER